jgi:hypothetical protein
MLTILPLSYEALPHLHDTPDLDDGDEACLAEVRDVLGRHGKPSRFAIHLAHKHFDLAPDEVLIEYPNEKARTQHVVVGKLARHEAGLDSGDNKKRPRGAMGRR